MTTAFELSEKRRLLLDKLLRKEGFTPAVQPGIPRRPDADTDGPAPLSFGQQRLWFLQQLDPGTTAYNISEGFHFHGLFDTGALEKALSEVVRRHEVLRTVFPARDGEPVQIPLAADAPEARPALARVDLSGLPEPARWPEGARAAAELARRPFDLARGLPLTATLLRLAADRHALVLSLHHIATDGWSMGILIRELTALYAAFATGRPTAAAGLPELPIQYADYAHWQRGWLDGEALDGQASWWKEALGGAPTVLEIPTDRPRPAVQSSRGARLRVAVDRATTDALRDLAEKRGASLYMALVAALGTLLHRYTGADDLLLGSPSAGRGRPEVEGLIGFFVNTLVLRVRLADDPDFHALLARVRENVLGADAHKDLPFEKLVDLLDLPRDLSRNALFQVMLSFQNLPAGATGGGAEPGQPRQDVGMTPFGLDVRTAQFDLHFLLEEGPQGLQGDLEYRTDLFDGATVRRLAEHFGTLLRSAVHDPGAPVSRLPWLADGERHQLLAEWNDTAEVYPEDRDGPCLHHLIAAQAARTPDAPAASFEGLSLTYAELERRASDLAAHLSGLGCGPGSRVGVAMERSLELVVALYGILKAGGAYVPLDPDYPRERLASMLEDSRPAVLLTQEHLRERLPDFVGPVLTKIEPAPLLTSPLPQPSPSQGGGTGGPTPSSGMGGGALSRAAGEGWGGGSLSDDHLAYLIFTSGSTGRPKGATVHHRAIRNRLLWMQQAYGLGPADTVLQKTPFSFDVSVWEFFWPLMTGARIVLAQPGGHRDPAYLAGLIRQEGVTVLHFVPSLLQAFLEEPAVSDCASVRLIVASGEALGPELVRRFFERFDGADLENLYGPTEAAVDVTRWSCRPGDVPRSTPIGRPIANTAIHLVDRHGDTVPAGVPGELWIGGVNVGRGYFGRPDLTAERFTPDPFGRAGDRVYRTGDLARFRPDGAIEFLGRLDHQVKIRGQRIELGEIEAALARHPAVREAAVNVHEGAQARRLVAYYVPRSDAETPEVTPAELRALLQESLPESMVPAFFVPLDRLPLSPNGKLDRKALPAPDPVSSYAEREYLPPDTPAEKALAAIWAEVLGVERVGAHDNFFSLGGDSILSIRVLARARDLGLDFSLQQIFQHQTVHELAKVAGDGLAGAAEAVDTEPFSLISEEDRGKLPEGVEDAYPLAQLQAGMLFESELSPETATYHDIYTTHLQAPYDAEKLREALQRAVDLHPLLRTSFDLSSYGEPLQLVHRHVEVDLTLEDIQHLERAAQDELLENWQEEEKRRPFDWRRAPLMRFLAFRRSPGTFQFALSFHHAILDGWSVSTLLAELFRTYLALCKGEAPADAPPTTTFRQFVALERAALRSEETRRYWHALAESGTATLLPRWHPRPEPQPGQRSGLLETGLPPQLAGELRRIARDAGVPLKSLLLAVHSRVLAALSGQGEVITGLVSNGRPEEEGGERVLGLFLNTLPFRLALPGGTWAELIRQAFDSEREMLVHRRYPMVELQREAGGRMLFEAAFGFVHFHVFQGLAQFEEIRSLGGDYYEETNFAFIATFNLDPFNSMIVQRIEYEPTEFHADQIATISRYYHKTLEAVAAGPSARYDALSLITEEERGQILAGWNRPEAAFPAVPAEGLLHRRFEAAAARAPEAPALSFEGSRISYAELDRRANRLARHLRRAGVGPESRVGLCVGRTPNAVVALLAILKAGGAYLPLDPEYPADRLAFMLEDSGARVLVTEEAFLDRLPPEAGRRTVLLDAHREALERESGDALPPGPLDAVPANAAYLIYTSGSTGRPKGVVVPHATVARLLTATEDWYGFGPEDVWTLFHSYAFDFSVWEIWGALAYGGRLVVVPFWISRSPDAFYDLLADEGVTVLNQTPSAFRQLLQAETEKAAPRGLALRSVIFGGEALEISSLAGWFERHGDEKPRLVNMYGITETTVHVTYRPLTAADAAYAGGAAGIPGSVVGVPIPDLQVYVLDRHQGLAPPWVPGEIHVGGAGLSRGYLNRPELTAERFVPDPFATRPGERLYRTGDLARFLPGLKGERGAELEHLGRIDHQVKVRGFRIELGEIESALARHPAVAQAVVRPREDTPGDRRLVAYLVPSREAAGPVLELMRLEREGQLADRPLHELPNGMPVFHLNRSETDFLYHEIFAEGAYLKHGVELRDGDCVFDVGANIGLFSLWAASRLAGATYYAFEPIPPVFDRLRRNAELYGLDARLFPCGLAEASGSADFAYYPHVSVISGRFADAAQEKEVVRSYLLEGGLGDLGGAAPSGADLDELLADRLTAEVVHCELRTLSEVIAEHGVERIDLLKVDVEKSELEVLAGIEERHWPRIRQIVVEVHDVNGRLDQALALLEGHGYQVTVEQDAALRGTPLFNLFAVRPGQTGNGQAAASSNGGGDAGRFAWSHPSRLLESARAAAAERLPDYMVPNAFLLLERLPLTPNGKLDVRALPAPDAGRRDQESTYAAPRTPTEETLARIWAEVLRVERVGIDDNFLELGGHSLLAMQLISRVRQTFQIDLPLRALYEANTVANLAVAITNTQAEAADAELLARLLAEIEQAGPETPTPRPRGSRL